MLPLVVASNILRLDDSGDILYINPGMEENLADVRYEPDESETITVDDLLDFDSGILCSVAETNEQCYFYALSDLAASTIQTDVRSTATNDFREEDFLFFFFFFFSFILLFYAQHVYTKKI